jgi:hypothetical protein
VLTNCRQAACDHGDLIKFRTIGVGPPLLGGTWSWSSERGVVYKGTVSAPDMHGSYQTPMGSGVRRGVWSARQLGQ